MDIQDLQFELAAGRDPATLSCVYSRSVFKRDGVRVMMADAGDADVIIADTGIPGFTGEAAGRFIIAPLTHGNADALRAFVPYTKPVPVLDRDATMGVGDRLGIAAPGHIRVFEACDITPVLAQQSMRELSLTHRAFTDVIDTASFGVFRAGYKGGFGADGDHLKTLPDIKAALDTGCTMITLDCSEHIHKDASDTPGIYDDAIAFTKTVYDAFFADGEYSADLEISIDETDAPTAPDQHRYIATELRARGVKFSTLAPRFCGEFQKGIDYMGDLAQFEREIAVHASIASEFGYKLSIHSGSDKFSVFPIIAKYVHGRFHLKTAGTSWLEAMRVVAAKDPSLYREAHNVALDTFDAARKYYHVTTNLDNVPPLDSVSDAELPALFENDDARQLIHITYGFILDNDSLKDRLYKLWRQERQAYSDALYRHIGRHAELITGKSLRG